VQAEEPSCCASFDDVAQKTSARILMRCPELWAVAKDIIQELTFLARENCRAKSFFIDLKNQGLSRVTPVSTPNAT